jgi:cytochrome c
VQEFLADIYKSNMPIAHPDESPPIQQIQVADVANAVQTMSKRATPDHSGDVPSCGAICWRIS